MRQAVLVWPSRRRKWRWIMCPNEKPLVRLSSRQSIQWMLVDNEIDIKQSLWVTLEAAAKAQRGEPFRKEAAMAKLVATEAGGRVVDRCMQMFGGLGVAKDLPFERWFREMRIRRIGEGP